MDARYIPWLILGIYTLYTIGNELEAELGSGRYLALYFACAAYGGLGHALVQYFVPAFFPGTAVLPGATLCAPVIGIAATAARRWPRRPVLFLFFLPLRLSTAAVLLGAGWFACAWWMDQGLGASIAGLATAGIVAALEPRVDLAFERASVRRERERFVEEVELRRRTDGILDKITREGMASLTREERRTLKLASRLFARGREKPHE